MGYDPNTGAYTPDHKPRKRRRKRRPNARQRVRRLLHDADRTARRRRRRHRGLSGKEMRSLAFGEGGNPRDVWERATPGQRRRIKRRAAREGVTIRGWIAGGPHWLRPRSPAGIKRAAERAVGAGYAPAERELKDRDRRIRNLETKREIDQRYYDQWLTTRSAEIESAAHAADAAVLASQQQEQAAIGQTMQKEQARRTDYLAAQGGNVSGGAQGQFEQLSTLDEQERAEGVQAAGAARTRGDVLAGSTVRSAFRQANIASGEATRRKFRGEMHDDLRDLEEDWKKLRLQRAADVAKEVGRLEDVEIQKSEHSREFSLASEKLGADVADKRAKNRLAGKKYKLDVKKYKAKLRIDRANVRIKQINNRLKARDLGRKERDSLLKERGLLETVRHNKASEGIARSKGGNKTGSKARKRMYGKAISTIRLTKNWQTKILKHSWRARAVDILVGKGIDHDLAVRAVRHLWRRSKRRPANRGGDTYGRRN